MSKSKASHPTQNWLYWLRKPWEWLGFGENGNKSGLDLLQFLVTASIPILIFFGGLWYQDLQSQRAERETEERNRDAALQGYIDQMSQLLIDKEGSQLKQLDADSNVRSLMAARTAAVLNTLGNDKDRKVTLLHFLASANLVSKGDAFVSLKRATFSGTDLSGTDLSDIDLSGTDLSYTNLSHTDLSDANLSYANLSNADLSGAYLDGANLGNANLSDAVLSDVSLNCANLEYARLRDTDLSSVDISNAVNSDTVETKGSSAGTQPRSEEEQTQEILECNEHYRHKTAFKLIENLK